MAYFCILSLIFPLLLFKLSSMSYVVKLVGAFLHLEITFLEKPELFFFLNYKDDGVKSDPYLSSNKVPELPKVELPMFPYSPKSEFLEILKSKFPKVPDQLPKVLELL